MCLSKITNRHKKDEGIGYKVFYKSHGKLYSELQNTNIASPINKWVKSTPKAIATSMGEHYIAGFHIFRTRKNASSWFLCGMEYELRRVEYRKIIVSGKQSELSVIVAKEIKIIPIKGDKENAENMCRT